MSKELEEALKKAPPEMKFASAEAKKSWNDLKKYGAKNDPLTYGHLEFGEEWARLMEAKMIEVGHRLTEAEIDKCRSLADVIGTSGFTCGWTRQQLIVHWRYGKMLIRTKREKKDYKDPTKYYFVPEEE